MSNPPKRTPEFPAITFKFRQEGMTVILAVRLRKAHMKISSQFLENEILKMKLIPGS